MLFKRSTTMASNQSENVPQEVTDAVGFLTTLGRLTSHMEKNARDGCTWDNTLKTWHQWRMDMLLKQYVHVFDAQFPWWSYFRNPIWICIFNFKRRQFQKSLETIDAENLEKLDYYLGRAEFVFSLSVASRNFMRHQIAKGVLSRWSVYSLMRSFGCKITKEGSVSPSPIGLCGLVLGTTTALLMMTLFLLVALALGSELSQPCVRQCVVTGATQMMMVTPYLTMVAVSVSWGRRRAARMLSLMGLSK